LIRELVLKEGRGVALRFSKKFLKELPAPKTGRLGAAQGREAERIPLGVYLGAFSSSASSTGPRPWRRRRNKADFLSLTKLFAWQKKAESEPAGPPSWFR